MNDTIVNDLNQGIQTVLDTVSKALPGDTAAQVVAKFDWQYIAILVGIMLFTGLLGGLANYLNDDNEGRDVWKSLVLGVVATISIPLFLKIVDSSLIAGGKIDDYSLLVFAGFCILAAYYSAKFLEGLSNRILQDLQKKVEETDQKASQAAEKTDFLVETQMSNPAEEGEAERAKSVDYENLAGAAEMGPREKVEAAFGNHLHTLDSLVEKTGMSTDEVQKQLETLLKAGKVRRIEHRGAEVFGRVG
jgi:hypothetical protein